MTNMTKRIRKARTGERGFTLLELVIAMNMLTIGALIGIFPMQIYSIGMNRLSFQRTVASELAHEMIDNFHQIYAGTAWLSVTSDPVGFVGGVGICPNPPHGDNPNDPFHRHSIIRNGTTYTRVWSVAPTAQTNMYRVTAHVYWTPGDRTNTSEIAPDTENCVKVEASSFKYCNLGDGRKGICQ